MRRSDSAQPYFFEPTIEPAPYHPGPFYGMPVDLSDDDDMSGRGTCACLIIAIGLGAIVAVGGIALWVLA